MVGGNAVAVVVWAPSGVVTKVEVPGTIFKYEPFTLRAIQNLKASSVFFGSPAAFNDPYDCAVMASVSQTTREELDEVRAARLAAGDQYRNTPDDDQGLTPEEFNERVRPLIQEFLDTVRQEFLQQNGVTCFSETNDNLLMWSHYGGRHKGFCLEFSTEFKPFDKLQQVRYVDEMPQFRISEFLPTKNPRRLTEMFCTKSAAWAYEKEWRALHVQAGTLYGYPREALRAIYFGPEMDLQDRDLLCNIMYCQYPEAELWAGSRSSQAFKVEFHKLSGYLPYSVARERGLIE